MYDNITPPLGKISNLGNPRNSFIIFQWDFPKARINDISDIASDWFGCVFLKGKKHIHLHISIKYSLIAGKQESYKNFNMIIRVI